MKLVVSTLEELEKNTSGWEVERIMNDYKLGANQFTLTYQNESLIFKNQDLRTVAYVAKHYNGAPWFDVMEFIA